MGRCYEPIADTSQHRMKSFTAGGLLVHEVIQYKCSRGVVSYCRMQFHFDFPSALAHKHAVRSRYMLLNSVHVRIFSINMCSLCCTCHHIPLVCCISDLFISVIVMMINKMKLYILNCLIYRSMLQ